MQRPFSKATGVHLGAAAVHCHTSTHEAHARKKGGVAQKTATVVCAKRRKDGQKPGAQARARDVRTQMMKQKGLKMFPGIWLRSMIVRETSRARSPLLFCFVANFVNHPHPPPPLPSGRCRMNCAPHAPG
jgi:hypothetical protein